MDISVHWASVLVLMPLKQKQRTIHNFIENADCIKY